MRKVPTESEIFDMLQNGRLELPPVKLRLLQQEAGKGGLDAAVEARWQSQSVQFDVEIKASSTPKALASAIEEVRAYQRAARPNRAAMIIAPYLSESKLKLLDSAGISGIDLSGNGVITVPDQLLVYRTGQPNRFKDSTIIQSAYRGDSSLVARAMLIQPRFDAVGDILELIKQRGGSISFGTVSKAIKRLEEDMVIERLRSRGVQLIQPERLMEGLVNADSSPRSLSQWTGAINAEENDVLDRVAAAAKRVPSQVVQTGAASAARYATFAREPIVECYCEASPDRLIEALDVDAEETTRFPNLRLIQTRDQRAYFDARDKYYSSPIQSWLELALGDKRQRDAAQQIRSRILQDLENNNA